MWKKNEHNDDLEVDCAARVSLVSVAKKNWGKTVNRCLPNDQAQQPARKTEDD